MTEQINYIKKIYQEYTTGRKAISNEDMAASLELCLYLFKSCEYNKYKKIIDVGSGITSFVLRYYQKLNNDVIVYSVDDEKKWLNKTKEFVKQYDLNIDNFIYDIDSVLDKDFDLVVYDYGGMRTRGNKLQSAFNLCKVGGHIICDDCHKSSYYNDIKELVNKYSYNIDELLETEDKTPTKASRQRFSVKVTKK